MMLLTSLPAPRKACTAAASYCSSSLACRVTTGRHGPGSELSVVRCLSTMSWQYFMARIAPRRQAYARMLRRSCSSALRWLGPAGVGGQQVQVVLLLLLVLAPAVLLVLASAALLVLASAVLLVMRKRKAASIASL
jgi:hypothetical protein